MSVGCNFRVMDTVGVLLHQDIVITLISASRLPNSFDLLVKVCVQFVDLSL